MKPMRRILFFGTTVAAVFLMTANNRAAAGQEPPSSPTPVGPSTPAATPTPEDPNAPTPSSHDPLFDKFLSLRLLAHAWAKQDASELTDLALLLADGERVLMRNRKDFTSTQLLEIAAYCAATSGDKASLARIGKAAESRKDAGLQALVASASGIVPAAGIVTADKGGSGKTDRHAGLVYDATRRHILVIRMCGDKESLDSLKTAVGDMKELGPAQKERLVKMIDDRAPDVKMHNKDLRSTLQRLERFVEYFRANP